MTKLSDLPEDVRRQIAQGRARVKGAAGVRVRTTTPAALNASPQWRCHECGEEFHQWAPANRHREKAGPGHGRIEVILDAERVTLPTAAPTPKEPR